MLFVEQCERWQREGGAVGHVMGGMMKLVLDGHCHAQTAQQLARSAHKRLLSATLPQSAAATCAEPSPIDLHVGHGGA